MKEVNEKIKELEKKERFIDLWEKYKNAPANNRRAIIEGKKSELEKTIILKNHLKKEKDAKLLKTKLDKESKINHDNRDKTNDWPIFRTDSKTREEFKEDTYEVDI